jgi:hypothetical protein
VTAPMVRCATHGDRLLGYIVCVHVLNEAAVIGHRIDPTPDDLGEALCAVCAPLPRREPNISELRLICSKCVDALCAALAEPPALG